MGAYTPTAKVWYADTSDSAKLDTVTAMQASSIENGLGARMTLQEKAIGLHASVATNGYQIGNLTVAPGATIPYAIRTGTADFTQGLTINGSGIVTIQTPGMYLVGASLGPSGGASGPGVKLYAWKNGTAGTLLGTCETPMNTNILVTSNLTAVFNCIAGDTLSCTGFLTSAPVNNSYGNQDMTTFLSVVLVKALASS